MNIKIVSILGLFVVFSGAAALMLSYQRQANEPVLLVARGEKPADLEHLSVGEFSYIEGTTPFDEAATIVYFRVREEFDDRDRLPVAQQRVGQQMRSAYGNWAAIVELVYTQVTRDVRADRYALEATYRLYRERGSGEPLVRFLDTEGRIVGYTPITEMFATQKASKGPSQTTEEHPPYFGYSLPPAGVIQDF